jgi:hypothetical protein
MRTRLLLIPMLLVLVLVLAGCGGGGGDKAGSDGKQSKISEEAYPTMKKFAASDIALENYGPVCDELGALKDKVAQVSEKTCRTLVTLTTSLDSFKATVNKCKNLDCVATKTEPIIRNYLTSFGDALRTHNTALAGVLKPGPCLTALQTSKADLDKLDASLARLPSAIKDFRGGNRNALDGLFQGDFGTPDPSPCKP